MNTNRSYLDTLNLGRQRRARTPIEDLNRTLDELENRFGKPTPERSPEPVRDHREDTGSKRYRSRADQPFGDEREDDFAARWRSQRGAERPHAGGYPDPRDERAAPRQGGRLPASPPAPDLGALRDELQTQVTSELRREFAALRKDIEAAYRASPDAGETRDLGAELERLSGAIHSMADRSDDRGVNLLRLELEQVRETLSELAREDTLRSIDHRWAEMDSRWAELGQRAAGAERDPAIDALAARLEQIGEAVGNLPDSLALRSLDDKVRTLASAVDHFSRQAQTPGPRAFEIIEERLDEISRAIVASSVATQPHDAQIMERIEARIAALAAQIEEQSGDRPDPELIEHLEALAHRIDEVARQAALPQHAIDRLVHQVALIAERLEDDRGADERARIVDSLERRFAEIAALFEERHEHADARGHALFRDLDQRIQELADKLDNREPLNVPADPALLRALDEKFADLSERIDARPAFQPEIPESLERRLAEISSRLETTSNRTADIDPSLIRSLESQVADLTAHLARPAQPMPDFEALAPRLEGIEQSLAEQRDVIVAAAREAADNAVRAMGAGGMDSEDADALAQELHTLENLMRRSDERNSRTFEAIHDTLLKIVDRLGTIETRQSERPAESVKMAIAGAPPIAPATIEPAPDAPARGERIPAPTATVAVQTARARRSPAEAAAEAALAAAETARETEATQAKTSMLGGLARKLTGRKAPAPAPMAEQREPSLAGIAEADLDAPLQPDFDDKPLEPGSGAPDLNAIMKRVRDERGQSAPQGDPAAAKADFIAAARRAAQAAAAEVETFKRGSDKGAGKGGFSASEFLRARRKPILMAAAAIMIALAGLQLGKAFLGDRSDVAGTAIPAATQQSLVASAPDEEDLNLEALDETDDETLATAAPVRMIDDAELALAEDEAWAREQTVDAETVDMETAGATLAAVTPPAAPAAIEVEPLPAPAGTAFAPAPLDAGPIALREAADAGDAKAVFEIGSRYADGRGGEADMATAARWYERAAELGFAPAQYRIGNFLEKGIGVERDIPQAKTWYQLAANQGNASAMHNLAVLFAMGTDGAPDNDSAARWFLNAAELGVKDSQFNLGILAAKGLGVPQSLEDSYKWFAIAAKAGDKDAAAKRDEVANALRPDQLSKARAAAELWKPRPLIEDANTVEIPEAWRESAGTTASIDLKQAVRTMQTLLNKHGYDAGAADGVMGQRTRNAIVAFQKDNGMEPTGDIDEPLVRALLDKG